MNASDTRLFELALKKQRLQFASDALRTHLVDKTSFLGTLCAGADRVRDAWSWFKARPVIPVAVTVALIVSRPRGAWRWLRRGLGAWQLWKKARRFVGDTLVRQA